MCVAVCNDCTWLHVIGAHEQELDGGPTANLIVPEPDVVVQEREALDVVEERLGLAVALRRTKDLRRAIH